jgi:hypothetical protein
MTSVPPTIAAEIAITKQNVALSVMKQNFEQQQKLVEIIDQAARSAPLSGTRGSNVNFSA